MLFSNLSGIRRVLLMVLSILLLYTCQKNKHQGFSHKPTHLIYKKDVVPFKSNIDEKSYLTILEDTDIHPQGIEVMELDQDRLLIFSRDDQKLYLWDGIGRTSLIAMYGDAPNQIQSGVRFLRNNDTIYLLQRLRISEISCIEETCALKVTKTFNEMVTYFETFGSGNMPIAGSFIPNMGVIRYNLANEWQSIGGYFFIDDIAIATHLNTSTLIKLSNGDGYLQIFSLLPYILFINNNFKVEKVYKLAEFNRPIINSIKNRSVIHYELDFEQSTSTLVWFYERNEETIFVIRNFEMKTLSNHPMDKELSVFGYDYYSFNSINRTITYIGSSDRFIIPLTKGYLFIDNYTLKLSK